MATIVHRLTTSGPVGSGTIAAGGVDGPNQPQVGTRERGTDR